MLKARVGGRSLLEVQWEILCGPEGTWNARPRRKRKATVRFWDGVDDIGEGKMIRSLGMEKNISDAATSTRLGSVDSSKDLTRAINYVCKLTRGNYYSCNEPDTC